MEFYQTLMGRKFYEGTMPALVKAVEALTDKLDELLEEQQEQDEESEECEVVNLEDERAAAAFAMREAIADAVWAHYKSPHVLDIIRGTPLPGHAPEAAQEGR